MDFTSIKLGLEGFVERYDSQTYLGSYRETSRSSLLNDGLSTRANSLWKMAEYVVAKNDGSDSPIEDYINGWKILASSYNNQFLLLEESPSLWGIYDAKGERLGGEVLMVTLYRLIICQITALPFVLNPLCYLRVFLGLARVVWFGSWLLRPVLNVCKIKMGLLQETIA